MLRSLFSIWSSRARSHRAKVSGRTSPSDEVVLYARIDTPMPSTSDRGGHTVPTPAPPTTNHRARLLSMNLLHLRLCSERRCERLASIGIASAGDLLSAEPLAMAKRMGVPAKAVSTLRKYQQAIKLAASVPGLMPRDAMLLVEIHRRTVRALSIDSPVMLHRDLERYAMSSRGQRLLRGRRLPSLRRVRKWVDACSAPTLSVGQGV